MVAFFSALPLANVDLHGQNGNVSNSCSLYDLSWAQLGEKVEEHNEKYIKPQKSKWKGFRLKFKFAQTQQHCLVFLSYTGFAFTVYPSHNDFPFHTMYHMLKFFSTSNSELQKQSQFLTMAAIWLVAELNWSWAWLIFLY